MSTSIVRGSIKLTAALTAVGLTALSGVAVAGFCASPLGTITGLNNHVMLRLSDGPGTGITHDLTPDDGYVKFRVNVRHADSAFPLIGYNSDSFDPNYGLIRICDAAGCDAPSIDVGIEDLDWTDASRVTVRLEAKACQLCGWESYEIGAQ